MSQPEPSESLASGGHTQLHRFHHNVKAYGAVGDGSANDTAAVQAAVDAAAAVVDANSSGGIVYFPAGEYKVNIVIPAAGRVTLQGAGPDSTVLYQQTSGTTIAFNTGAPNHVAIKGMTIFAGATGIGFATDSAHIVIEDVKLVDQTTACIAFTDNVLDLSLNRVEFTEHDGYAITANGTAQINTVHLDRCWFQSPSYTAYINLPYTTGQLIEGWLFTKCVFEGPAPAGSTASIIMGAASQIVFQNCHWADYSGGAAKPLFQTVAGANGIPSEIVFIGCQMTNIDSVIFNFPSTGAGATGGDWVIMGSVLNSNGSPFTFTNPLVSITIISTWLVTTQASWGTTNAAYLLGCFEGGAHVPLRTIIGGTTTFSVDASGRPHTPVIATGSLPAAAAALNGSVIIEDAGAGNRNLIIYAGGERFRIDGGANV